MKSFVVLSIIYTLLLSGMVFAAVENYSSGYEGLGHSVEMLFTYHINNSQYEDFAIGDRYIITNKSGFASGLLFAGGNEFGSSINKSDGTGLWSRSYDNGSTDRASDVAVDSKNNVIMVGSSINSNYDAFLIKYSYNGSALWNTTYSSSAGDYLNGVAVDSDDNITVAINNNFYYTVKYNSTGTQLWTATYNSQHVNQIQSITVDSKDAVIVTGGIGNQNNDFDIKTIKYSNIGDELWSNVYDDGANEYGFDVATDSSDNIIVVGYSNDNKAFLIKYNSTMDQLWNTTYDTPASTDIFYGVAVDSNDNIIAVGYNSSGTYANDIIIVKYNSLGAYLWNITVDITSIDRAYDVNVDNDNNIIVSGEVFYDIYIIKYDNNGNPLWNVTNNPGTNDRARGVAVDSYNDIIASGYINNNDMYVIKYDTRNDYDISMKQSLDENRFLFFFTQSTASGIIDKVLNYIGIPLTILGTMVYSAPNAYPIFIRLIYDNMDIINRLSIKGSKNLVMTNEGNNERGVPKINIGLVP